MPGRYPCKVPCRCLRCDPQTRARANAVHRKRGNAPTDPLVRFWSMVNAEGDGCWEWTGSGVRDYGRFVVADGQRMLAHRFAWEMEHGPIPAGLLVCHLCDNPKCVRASHLYLGSNADNMRDMAAKGRAVSPRSLWTHCKHGHEFTPDNTIVRKGTGYRRCRTCWNAAQREKRAWAAGQVIGRLRASEMHMQPAGA